MENMITIEREKLQMLVDHFFDVCGFCDELDIYEWEEGDREMQNMEEWVKETFGRNLENL